MEAIFGQLSCPSAPVYVHISTSGTTASCNNDSDHAKCGGVLSRLRLKCFWLRARVYSNRFRPCISSLGHFRKFSFRNISTFASRSDTKLMSIMHTDIVYRNIVSDSKFHFRFRHRAPLKNFRFLHFSPKRRPLAGTVVPRFKLLVARYKMGYQVGPYPLPFGGQGPQTQNH